MVTTDCAIVFFLLTSLFYAVPGMSPEDLRCAALTSTSLQVSWQPPPLNYQNGLLQGYKVSFEPMADEHMHGKLARLRHNYVDSTEFLFTEENDNMDTRKTTALTTVLTTLKKFSNYSIQVLAYTRMGDGAISHPIFCHTEEDGKCACLMFRAIL